MKTPKPLQPYQRLNPLNDYLFLKVMGEKGSEIQLLGFLNAVLGRAESNKLASVEILESKTLTAESIGAKASILDVRAMLCDGTRVNIEVQLLSKISDKSCYPSKYIILFIFYKASQNKN